MTTPLARRIEQLERALAQGMPGPCFVMAVDRSAAEREIQRLQAEHGECLPRTLFVMICPGASGDAQ